jgi:hypothetical protein
MLDTDQGDYSVVQRQEPELLQGRAGFALIGSRLGQKSPLWPEKSTLGLF